ncbi:MAG: hypothetical protein IPK82_39220 [Polyangiaceae bacterium]|nr:hypothetical protein [Polyangiaceae bacterium]
MSAPPADFLEHAGEYLEAEELAPDDVEIDEAVDVIELDEADAVIEPSPPGDTTAVDGVPTAAIVAAAVEAAKRGGLPFPPIAEPEPPIATPRMLDAPRRSSYPPSVVPVPPVADAAVREPTPAVIDPPPITPRMSPVKPQRPSPVLVPSDDEVTPTGRVAVLPARSHAATTPLIPPSDASEGPPSQRVRREGTDPMMNVAAPAIPAPPAPANVHGVRARISEPPTAPRGEGTDPMLKVPTKRTEGTDPMLQVPSRVREGTDPMMRVPEAPREGTDPMMRLPDLPAREVRMDSPTARGTFPIVQAPPPVALPPPAAPPAVAPQAAQQPPAPAVVPQVAAVPPAVAVHPVAVAPPPHETQPRVMTGAYAIPQPPEQVLPFRARTGTIPPERPNADLAGVLPFRPAGGWAQPALPQGLESGSDGRLTPPDPMPAARAEAPYVPVAAMPHIAPVNAPSSPPLAASYPPAPAPPAALAPVESASGLSAVRRDQLMTSAMPSAPPMEAFPFQAAAHGQPMQAHGAHAMAPMVAPPSPHVAAPQAPPAPQPPPPSLPTDAWKLVRSPVLYPFAVGAQAAQAHAAQAQAAQVQAAQAQAAMARQAGVGAPLSAPPASAFAQDPGVVVPASLAVNAPRLTLEQYACLAAELAISPASAAQVRQRYGLDDSAHLAEQSTWQRRFSLDAQLFASYSSLFQHYRDWLNQQARR